MTNNRLGRRAWARSIQTGTSAGVLTAAALTPVLFLPLAGCQSHVTVTTAILDRDYLRLADLDDRMDKVRDDLLAGWEQVEPNASKLPTAKRYRELSSSPDLDDQKSVGRVLHKTFGTKYSAMPPAYRPTEASSAISNEQDEWTIRTLSVELDDNLFYGETSEAATQPTQASRNVIHQLNDAYMTYLEAVDLYDEYVNAEAKKRYQSEEVAPIGLLVPYQAKQVLALVKQGEDAFGAAVAAAKTADALTVDSVNTILSKYADLDAQLKVDLLNNYGITATTAADGKAVTASEVDTDATTAQNQKARAVGDEQAKLLFGGSLRTDPNASLVARAPESYWTEGFNSAKADANIGNTDIAIKVETNVNSQRLGSATVYSLTMDAEDATRATFSTIKETVRFATLMAGVGGVLPAVDASGKSKDQAASSENQATTPGTISYTLDAEQSKRKATQATRTTRRTTLIALDALATYGEALPQPAVPPAAPAAIPANVQARLKATYEAAAKRLKTVAGPEHSPGAGG